MYSYFRKLFGLFVLLLSVSAYAATNPYTHVYYYGWFPGNWTINGCYNLDPLLTNHCPGGTCTKHIHAGSSVNDLSCVFYPKQGEYSTTNNTVLDTHAGNILNAGVRSAIISFGSGNPTLAVVTQISTRFGLAGVKSSFAIRNYSGRTWDTVDNNILSLKGAVSSSNQYKAQYNTLQDNSGVFRPVFYLYAPLSPDGGCPGGGGWGCIFLATSSFRQANRFIVLAGVTSFTYARDNGFDGFYNYSPNMPHDSNFYNGRSSDAWNNGLMFSAGVAPGYNTKRTKNDGCRTRSQVGYRDELKAARGTTTPYAPHFVSIISFNEWNEGTQIEPAFTNPNGTSGITVSSGPDVGYQYLGYQDSTSNNGYPNLYLDITDNFVGPGKWDPKNNGVVTRFPVQ